MTAPFVTRNRRWLYPAAAVVVIAIGVDDGFGPWTWALAAVVGLVGYGGEVQRQRTGRKWNRLTLAATAVAIVMLLTACLPANPYFGSYPVHPQYVSASDSGPCMVGMTADNVAQIDTWLTYENTDQGNLEFWYSFGSGLADTVIDEAACWRAFLFPRVVYWWCGNGYHTYVGPQDATSLAAFRIWWVCQPDGTAIWAGPEPH